MPGEGLCPLGLADMSVCELHCQTHSKGLFMERAIFKACRTPGGAGAPATVTGTHRPTTQISKAGTCRDFCGKDISDTFQVSSDFLTTQTTCLLTIPANIHLTWMPCTDMYREHINLLQIVLLEIVSESEC